MKLTFIGHGYVGLVTAAVFADLGNTVYVIGHTKEKIDNLNKGIIPIYEPGLSELVQRNVRAKRLVFTMDYDPHVGYCEIVFITVGTPPKENGQADLTTVFEVAKRLGKSLKGYTVVATKSTVPVGTNRRIGEILKKAADKDAKFDIASVPEFLREGSAIHDTLHPDRIIVGTESAKARDSLVELHKPIDSRSVLCSLETAEMIKYASNSLLATKISFANAIAKLSELTGADGLKVLEGVGLDSRIGRQFLEPGAGYGGSCFPKDVKALISIAKQHGYSFSLLSEVERVNQQAREDIVQKAKTMLKTIRGKRIGILGLAFKSNTDDMRDAPSIDIIRNLHKQGAHIIAYDPQATANAKRVLPEIEYAKDMYTVAKRADLLIVLTEWNEFKELDFYKIKQFMNAPKLIDGRNIYDLQRVSELGFTCTGVGR